jgi:hypothetical protein
MTAKEFLESKRGKMFLITKETLSLFEEYGKLQWNMAIDEVAKSVKEKYDYQCDEWYVDQESILKLKK